MHSVALIGLAKVTREGIRQSSADEFWALNWSYKYDFIPRIDRLFEMHPVWAYAGTKKKEYKKPREHWKWLQEPHPYPIYMLHQLPSVPACVRYPIEAVTADIFGDRLIYGDEPRDYYSSSFDYMMALAIYERWDIIELYGFEMGSITEYRYQREGAAGFVMAAVARGITVKRPRNSVLLRAKRYGYEGGQMIFRQDLERFLEHYEEQRRDEMARLQNLEGQHAAFQANGADEESVSELLTKIREQRDKAAIAAGAYQAVSYMIREVDLEEPELELINPFETVKL